MYLSGKIMSWLKRFSRKDRLDAESKEKSKEKEADTFDTLKKVFGIDTPQPVYEAPHWTHQQHQLYGAGNITQYVGQAQLDQLQYNINYQAQQIQQNVQQAAEWINPVNVWGQSQQYIEQQAAANRINSINIFREANIFGVGTGQVLVNDGNTIHWAEPNYEAKIKMIKTAPKKLAKRNLPDWF